MASVQITAVHNNSIVDYCTTESLKGNENLRSPSFLGLIQDKLKKLQLQDIQHF